MADGAAQLAALAAALKEAGNKTLQRELAKGLNAAVKPFREAVAQSALETLPSGGGLNQVAAAAARPRIQRRAQGIRAVAKGKNGLKGLAALNAGSVRHPVFNRGGWSSQAVTPGFWDRPAEELKAETQQAVQKAIDTVAAKVEGSV